MPQRRDTGRHRAGADQDDLVAEHTQPGQLVTQPDDDVLVDDAELVGDGRRPDLGDDPHGQTSSWYSKLKLAIQMMSPSEAPARVSRRGTPMRLS
jgi:hypothetical protein